MKKDIVILVAEDDEGHFLLTQKNLQRAGIWNELIRFPDGQDAIDFLFMRGDGPKRQRQKEYLLLLDIRMPKVDGFEVLEQLKQDGALKKIPVIILTTSDDPTEIERCYKLGCSIYIVKPVEYEGFIDAIKKVGSFLSTVKLPQIDVEY